MADTITTPILSVCATVGSKLPDLVIKDGQLIFVQDKHKIALDFNGKRVFYNQIEELATEQARTSILAPLTGVYYFVIETATMWTYRDKWIQLTEPPKEVVFVGTELPELGTSKTIYADTYKKEISVWDANASAYVVVADRTISMSIDEIDALFND